VHGILCSFCQLPFRLLWWQRSFRAEDSRSALLGEGGQRTWARPAVPSGHHQHQIQQRAPAPRPFPLPLYLIIPRSFLLPLLCYFRVRLQSESVLPLLPGAFVADFATNFERNLTDTPRISLDLQRLLTLQSGCLRTSANAVVRVMQPELYRIAEVEQLYVLTVPSHYLDAVFKTLNKYKLMLFCCQSQYYSRYLVH
jgi:hypothetical protein